MAEVLPRLQHFLQGCAFGERGGVMTDLDGTAVHEIEGRVLLSRSVEDGLRQVHAAGREVMVNTLRFPLSIIRVFADEWLRATGSDMHAVSLKGSLVGRIVAARSGQPAFEELAAWPLAEAELREILDGVRGLDGQDVDDLLVFFYPRRWTEGELIWTPDAARIGHVQAKYRSASRVFAGGVAALEAELFAQPQCMVFMLIDVPQDRLMAYQHTGRARFFTHAGVDKRSGGLALAAELGLSLADSIGAGDAEADTFLDEVGFAAIVGNQDVAFRGRSDTVRLADPPAFGELLLATAEALR